MDAETARWDALRARILAPGASLLPALGTAFAGFPAGPAVQGPLPAPIPFAPASTGDDGGDRAVA